MKTRVTELLGIEYPIIKGPMARISVAGLVAAVSNAGGLGVLSPAPPRDSAEEPLTYIQDQIRRIKSLTDKPFAVNFPMPHPGIDIRPWVDAALTEGFPIATTSGGDPARVVPVLKSAGVKSLHVVGSVRQAQKAEEQGCDAVITQGFEAGGIGSRYELTTFVLVPQVADAVGIPVVAGGGIADARGFVAALVLGAEGVQIGTRFLATKECIIDEQYKQALIDAKDTSTVMIRRDTIPSRAMRNEAIEEIIEMDRTGTSEDEIMAFIDSRWSPDINLNRRFIGFGEDAGLIREVLTVREVIEGIMKEADAVLGRVQGR
jgi:NAD(P)H-dependent flavin oxidoreductase YrpB (nitropropane dioxygenase family)